MSRAEVLEISINKLRQAVNLRDQLLRAAMPFAPPALGARINYLSRLGIEPLHNEHTNSHSGLNNRLAAMLPVDHPTLPIELDGLT